MLSVARYLCNSLGGGGCPPHTVAGLGRQAPPPPTG